MMRIYNERLTFQPILIDDDHETEKPDTPLIPPERRQYRTDYEPFNTNKVKIPQNLGFALYLAYKRPTDLCGSIFRTTTDGLADEYIFTDSRELREAIQEFTTNPQTCMVPAVRVTHLLNLLRVHLHGTP